MDIELEDNKQFISNIPCINLDILGYQLEKIYPLYSHIIWNKVNFLIPENLV